MSKVIHNFGKNVSFEPKSFVEPENEKEVLQLLKRHHGQSIRVAGSRHAWSNAIETDGLLISLRRLDHVRVDKQHGTVHVGAGCQVKNLLSHLKSHNLTLPSLGLIDEQTIAGATATGTHGSGKHSLSHYIKRVRIAHFDSQTGEPVISVVDSGLELQAARCSLGLMGVIVELELEARDAYQVEEHIERHESLDSILAAEEKTPLQQFFLIPWSWHIFAQHRTESTQARSRWAWLYRIYIHIGIDWALHLVILLMVKLLRFNFLIRGFYRFLLPLALVRKWRVIDESPKMLTMEHELFRHIEIELFVTRSQLENALEYLKKTIECFGGQNKNIQTNSTNIDDPIPEEFIGTYSHHYPICIRRILSDDTLISMASPIAESDHEDWYAISLISYEWPSRRSGFFAFANFLAPNMKRRFSARCHWGKYNPLTLQDNEDLYPKMAEFQRIAKSFDPDGQFSNDWLKLVLLDDEVNTKSV